MPFWTANRDTQEHARNSRPVSFSHIDQNSCRGARALLLVTWNYAHAQTRATFRVPSKDNPSTFPAIKLPRFKRPTFSVLRSPIVVTGLRCSWKAGISDLVLVLRDMALCCELLQNLAVREWHFQTLHICLKVLRSATKSTRAHFHVCMIQLVDPVREWQTWTLDYELQTWSVPNVFHIIASICSRPIS